MPQQASSFHQELSADTQFAGGSSESKFWRILVALLLHKTNQPEHKKHTIAPSFPTIPQDAYRSMGVPLLQLQQHGCQRPGVRHVCIDPSTPYQARRGCLCLCCQGGNSCCSAARSCHYIRRQEACCCLPPHCRPHGASHPLQLFWRFLGRQRQIVATDVRCTAAAARRFWRRTW